MNPNNKTAKPLTCITRNIWMILSKEVFFCFFVFLDQRHWYNLKENSFLNCIRSFQYSRHKVISHSYTYMNHDHLLIFINMYLITLKSELDFRYCSKISTINAISCIEYIYEWEKNTYVTETETNMKVELYWIHKSTIRALLNKIPPLSPFINMISYV